MGDSRGIFGMLSGDFVGIIFIRKCAHHVVNLGLTFKYLKVTEGSSNSQHFESTYSNNVHAKFDLHGLLPGAAQQAAS